MLHAMPYVYEPLDTSRKQIRLVRFGPPLSHTSRRSPDSQRRTLLTHLAKRFSATVQHLHVFDTEGKNSDSIVLELVTYNFEDVPNFTALSYEWGPSDDVVGIMIGQNQTQIRRNLYNFLDRYQSFTNRADYLWIDQICIDQQSIIERNHQVMLTADIYSGAEEVLIWAGHDPSAPVAFKSMEEIVSACNEHVNDRNFFGEGVDLILHQQLRPGNIDAIDKFYGLSYWTRHWIAQEIALAKHRTIMYSDELMPWQTLNSFVRFLGISKSLTQLSSAPDSLIDFVAGATENSDRARWIHAMAFGERSRCQNTQDKIFGIQSVFRSHLRVDVDYGRSSREIFEQAAHVYISYEPSYAAGVSTLATPVDLSRGLTQLATGMRLVDRSNTQADAFWECVGRLASRIESIQWLARNFPWSWTKSKSFVMRTIKEFLTGHEDEELQPDLDAIEKSFQET